METLHCTAYGHAVMARSLTVLHISFRQQVRQYIRRQDKKQTGEQIAYYMNNAKTIRDGLISAGYEVFGGVDAPYIWLKTPDKMTSWEFFDYLLEELNIVGTPGSGFGPSGEGYFRLTAFGSAENTVKAMDRIKNGKA